MPAKQFEASVRYRPGGAVVDLQGEIDGFAEEALNAAYAEAESKDPEVILLDFEGVNYINSTGIALIVGLLAKARASKRRVLACGLSDHYVEIFDITRLSDFVNVFPDEESAINSSQQSAISQNPTGETWPTKTEPNARKRGGDSKAAEETANHRRKADS